ncbi:MAG: hypothetical protein ACE5HI_05430 [bacterium]
MKAWVLDPGSGGVKIPKSVQVRTKQRILTYAEANYAGKYTRIDVRFRGQLCYIDAYSEPDISDDYPPPDFHESREEYVERIRNTPTHLCRLRYFGDEDAWAFAFYTYSHRKYETSILNNGSFFGTPEEAFETSAVYLQ